MGDQLAYLANPLNQLDFLQFDFEAGAILYPAKLRLAQK